MILFAEVADKVMTVESAWAGAVLFASIAFGLTAWRRRAVVIALPIALLWYAVPTSDLYDPFVGPAISRELGDDYIRHMGLAGGTPLVFMVAGIIVRSLIVRGSRKDSASSDMKQ